MYINIFESVKGNSSSNSNSNNYTTLNTYTHSSSSSSNRHTHKSNWTTPKRKIIKNCVCAHRQKLKNLGLVSEYFMFGAYCYVKIVSNYVYCILYNIHTYDTIRTYTPHTHFSSVYSMSFMLKFLFALILLLANSLHSIYPSIHPSFSAIHSHSLSRSLFSD